MNREILVKKRKALRGQATTLMNEVDQKIVTQVDRSVLVTLRNQVTKISEALKQVDSQMEQVLTVENAEGEFERVVEYEMEIEETISKIDLKLEEYETNSRTVHRVRGNNNNVEMQGTNRTEPSDLVKLPRLEMIKFDGTRKLWPRFWNQFERQYTKERVCRRRKNSTTCWHC